MCWVQSWRSKGISSLYNHITTRGMVILGCCSDGDFLPAHGSLPDSILFFVKGCFTGWFFDNLCIHIVSCVTVFITLYNIDTNIGGRISTKHLPRGIMFIYEMNKVVVINDFLSKYTTQLNYPNSMLFLFVTFVWFETGYHFQV